jgi:hypothetical protein
MAKKRALKNAAQDPLAKKAFLPATAKPSRKTHPAAIVLAFVVGMAGGILTNRWLKLLVRNFPVPSGRADWC